MFRWKSNIGRLIKEKWKKQNSGQGISFPLKYFTHMGGTRQTDYRLPGIVQDFAKDFDIQVKRFLRQASADDLNDGSYYDLFIEEIIELGKKNLDSQFMAHQSVISGIRSIEKGCLLTVQREKEQIQDILNGETKKKEVEIYEKIYGPNTL